MNELGYWVHKDTGVKTTFGLDADFIVNNVFGIPSWKMDASEIYVPEGITAIGAASLSGATNLVTLNLPSTLTEIRGAAFNGCTGLINFYIKAINPPSFVMPGGAVGNFSTQVKVPAASYDAYRVAPTWSLYINHIFVLNDLIPGSRVHEGYTHQPTSIVLREEDGLIIENKIFDGSTQIHDPHYGHITTWSCKNVIIRNCKFVNIKYGRCLSINESENITIYNCDFDNTFSGIRVWQCRGGVRIFSCDFHNMKGSLVSDNGSEGGAIQYQGCTGPYNRVQDNALEQDLGQGSTIDHISTYQSHFDSDSPMIMRNNWVRGGGPHSSGGGLLLGDKGGENMIMEDNILVDPGQYGISIAGGANMTMRRNKVYGSKRPFSNVGIVVADWSPENPPSGNYTVEYNDINWTGSHGGVADHWVQPAWRWPAGWDTNTFQNQSINPDMLPIQIIGIYPQVPDTHRSSGYWINKDTKVKAVFDLDAPWINGTVFNPMALGDIVSEVFVPEGITEISNAAFNGLSHLETITLPNTLTTIGNNVFAGCVGLVNLNVEAIIPPVIGELGINIGNFRTQIKVPSMSYDRYIASAVWSLFKNQIFVLNKLYPGSRFHNGYVPATQKINLTGVNNMVIENILFDGDVLGYDTPVKFWASSNIIIRNCKFINILEDRALLIENSSDVTIYNCDFIRCNAGILVGPTNTTSKNNVRIFSNDFKNITGDIYATKSGGAIQIANCTGQGYRIQDNSVENIGGRSSCEDLINIWRLYSIAGNPTLIRNNWLRGGGPSTSGAGVQIGDGGSSYCISEDNVCVSTGSTGVAISGGSYMTQQRNLCYSPQLPENENGMAIANWYEEENGPSTNITVRENRINWTNRNGINSPWWYSPNVEPVIGKETNVNDPTLDASILPPQIVGEYLPGTPPRPEVGIGYWIHKDTDIKTEFDGDAIFIQGVTFGNPQPAWKAYSSEVKIPEGIVSTAGNALKASTHLAKLYLPSTLRQLGTNSLSECPNLDELHIAAIIPPVYPQMDGGIGGANLKIYVPAESVNLYKSTVGWSLYSDKIFPSGSVSPDPDPESEDY